MPLLHRCSVVTEHLQPEFADHRMHVVGPDVDSPEERLAHQLQQGRHLGSGNLIGGLPRERGGEHGELAQRVLELAAEEAP